MLRSHPTDDNARHVPASMGFRLHLMFCDAIRKLEKRRTWGFVHGMSLALLSGQGGSMQHGPDFGDFPLRCIECGSAKMPLLETDPALWFGLV